ncbi:MAG: tetratricopeptide repeat protein [Microscillaceae bacterium]|nr:tetratricopeptide repeat protein [Microscillaceae bacterium]
MTLLFWANAIGLSWGQKTLNPPPLDEGPVREWLQQLETAQDTARIHLLLNLAWEYREVSPLIAQQFTEEAQGLSQALENDPNWARSWNQLGALHFIFAQQLSPEAVAPVPCQYFQVLAWRLASQKALQKSLASFQRSAAIAYASHQREAQSIALNNLGRVYWALGDTIRAWRYLEQALVIGLPMKNRTSLALILRNMGDIYAHQRGYFKALKHYLRASQILEARREGTLLADLSLRLAQVYAQLGNEVQAEKLTLQSWELAQRFKNAAVLAQAPRLLAQFYQQRAQLAEASRWLNLALALKDSIEAQQSALRWKKEDALFIRLKREERLELLKNVKIIREDELLIRRILQYGIWVAFISLAVFALLLYRSKRRSQKANHLLTYQKQEIAAQRDAIVHKNQELVQKHKEISEKNERMGELLEDVKRNNVRMTESIRYAERIQRALLPVEIHLRENFSDHFVIYKPRDVVSGDFYWFSRVGEMRFLAVVDCTGHGVPGALMSMIGNTLLNEIVNHEGVYETDAILSKLHEGIRTALKQQDSRNSDGMDLALCRIIPQENNEFQIQISGAKSTVYFFHQGHLETFRGDRKSIGGWQKESHREFSRQEFALRRHDKLYFGTDGYPDAANDKRRKLGYRAFERIICETIQQPMIEQGAALLEALYVHQGQTEQRDDITLLGIQL